ncbi:hypothetical protein LJC08_05275 [Methanimicrococcus sp. OttesenSCG-928-J09]|nr:hypothetical protein [Methanimicrococcus sp. OttesenSCG-928-J09]
MSNFVTNNVPAHAKLIITATLPIPFCCCYFTISVCCRYLTVAVLPLPTSCPRTRDPPKFKKFC